MAATDIHNGDSSDLPEEVNNPPAGIVLPPKEIRAIVEKTAGYVARNGPVFEDRIREKERSNPRFSFLNPADPYGPFYEWRLEEIREGRGTSVSAGRAGETPAAEPEKPKGPPEPPEFHFSARMPNINAQDLEVVKLTALFVAERGKSFMTALSQRETRNYQFDFLRPQHSLYQFFTRLVDQYTELLRSNGVDGGKSEKKRIAELDHNVNDKFHMLDRARQRAEWVQYQEQQKQQKEEEAEREQSEEIPFWIIFRLFTNVISGAYAEIDWHDFVVVETVLFTEADDQADLPPPTSLNDLQSASLEQKAMMSLQPSNMRIEEAMPTDQAIYYDQYGQTHAQPQYPVSALTPNNFNQPMALLPGAPVPVQAQNMLPPPPAKTAREEEEERLIRERVDQRERAAAAQAAARAAPGTQPMRIRNDYVPRAQVKRQTANTQICPNCKQAIPANEFDEHIRIELLDSRWKTQRQKERANAQTTNLSTSEVAANLKRLASQRTDVFDAATGQPIVSEEEAARRKRVALASYDGQPESKDANRMQSMNIEEQLRHIQEKAKQ
ncbi:MAG: SF3a splicing factor complex subunit [Cirrosporium novae-zelandiae]|nr:MAG: SF3a splicing factor complex subunit [Cirrosporium novae-zelandiae]